MRAPWDDSSRSNSSNTGDVRIRPSSYLTGFLLAAALGAAVAEPVPFSIPDYFRLARFGEVALSWDGGYIAYSVDRLESENGQPTHRVVVGIVDSRAKPPASADLDDARAFAWIPHTHELAFLSARSGSPQLHTVDVTTGAIAQKTKSPDGLTQFAFSPDGKRFAYATRSRSNPAESVFDKLRTDGPGLVVNPDDVSILDLLDPSFAEPPPKETALWIAAEGGDMRVDVPGDVARFHWSPRGDRLSVTYVEREIPGHIQRTLFSSIAVVDVKSGRLKPLFRGRLDVDGLTGVGYAGGEWLEAPVGLLVRRIDYSDPWVSSHFPMWTIADAEGRTSAWRSIELYNPRITTRDKTIFIEDTRRGVRGLAEWVRQVQSPTLPIAVPRGSNSLFSFSGDMKTAAFVNESLSRPPEIYVWVAGARESRPLTRENTALAERQFPTHREITWTAKDGVRVSGWLLEPPRDSAPKPWALLAFVHGGPGYAFSDQFAPYFPVWPYPLDVLALNGIAVFVPNYRGTESYGREIATPAAQDGAPADDIVSGIESLVADGIADIDRLGIAGQSHGGWLGPIAMTRLKRVRAGSFAEGISNMAVAYELMPGKLNRGVHDIKQGASLYDDPQDYLRQSPSLHFNGLESANLFEAGAQSGAFFALSYGKASERQHLPTETVIYPNSGHNLSVPKLMRESAERNLDWFRFWLLGQSDARPEKAPQYDRWRK